MLAIGTEIRYRIAAIFAAHWDEFVNSARQFIRPVVFETVRKIKQDYDIDVVAGSNIEVRIATAADGVSAETFRRSASAIATSASAAVRAESSAPASDSSPTTSVMRPRPASRPWQKIAACSGASLNDPTIEPSSS